MIKGLFIVVGIIVIAVNLLKKTKKGKPIYSLGLQEAETIRALISAKAFNEAEKLIKKLNSDNLTQTVDHVTLSLSEAIFIEWQEQAKDKAITALFLGVYYSHSAWKARTNAYAKDVSQKGIEGFFFYQEKATACLTSINENFELIGEVYSRLIRISMGNSNDQAVETYYKKAIAINPDMVWPYIHYAEAIQPKWGGSLEAIDALMNALPDRLLIRQIVELKLRLDSFIISENYFSGTMFELKEITKARLIEIDKSIKETPPKSIHRYILYNYMMALSGELNKFTMKKYYKNLMNDWYTLYPFGIPKS